MPLIKNVLKQLVKFVVIPLGLTTAASATDVAINKKMFHTNITTLIISNEETNDIMKIAKSVKVSGVSKIIKNEAKEQKGGFLSMLLGSLSAILLRNLLTGKGTIRADQDF